MRTWFTADTRFGLDRMIGEGKRPFASVALMDAALIRNWNETVEEDDEVWHLGDFGSETSADYLRWVFAALKGRKRLVQGNWDEAFPQTLALPWAAPPEKFLSLQVGGAEAFLCHYPMLEWPRRREGAIHLHGHAHGHPSGDAACTDVGVDAWDFRPIALAAIRERMAARPAPVGRLAA